MMFPEGRERPDPDRRRHRGQRQDDDHPADRPHPPSNRQDGRDDLHRRHLHRRPPDRGGRLQRPAERPRRPAQPEGRGGRARDGPRRHPPRRARVRPVRRRGRDQHRRGRPPRPRRDRDPGEAGPGQADDRGRCAAPRRRRAQGRRPAGRGDGAQVPGLGDLFLPRRRGPCHQGVARPRRSGGLRPRRPRDPGRGEPRDRAGAAGLDSVDLSRSRCIPGGERPGRGRRRLVEGNLPRRDPDRAGNLHQRHPPDAGPVQRPRSQWGDRHHRLRAQRVGRRRADRGARDFSPQEALDRLLRRGRSSRRGHPPANGAARRGLRHRDPLRVPRPSRPGRGRDPGAAPSGTRHCVARVRDLR